MPVAAGPTGHGASHELRDAVTSGYALRHSARQSGRTGIGRSVPACLCLPVTASVVAPFVRYAVTAGPGVRRLVPHQAPARRVHGARPSPPPQFSSLTEFGTVRSSQGPLGAGHLVTTFRATRDGHACRRSSSRTWRKAQL